MSFLFTAVQRLWFQGLCFAILYPSRCLSCLFSSYGAFDKWYFIQYTRAKTSIFFFFLTVDLVANSSLRIYSKLSIVSSSGKRKKSKVTIMLSSCWEQRTNWILNMLLPHEIHQKSRFNNWLLIIFEVFHFDSKWAWNISIHETQSRFVIIKT